MDIKPADIFIGVIDFFSVMLPGALLTYFLLGLFYSHVFVEWQIFPEPTTEPAKWAVFLLVAYIVGNLVFMLASVLDFTYGKFFKKLIQSKYNLSYKTATTIREKHIATDDRLKELVLKERLTQAQYDELLKKPDREIFNTFNWARHFIVFNKPEVLADIQRIMADSKFFRSLVVTFLIIGGVMFSQAKIILGIVFVVLSLLCYYRYGDLRFKSTEKAYELIITFFYLKPGDQVVFSEEGFEEEPFKISAFKKNLSEDFVAQNQSIISFLTKGINKPLKLITFGQTERQHKVFVSDQDETWYCLQGRGILNTVQGRETNQTFLIPNEIVPVEKETEFSFQDGGDESIEVLVLEK